MIMPISVMFSNKRRECSNPLRRESDTAYESSRGKNICRAESIFDTAHQSSVVSCRAPNIDNAFQCGRAEEDEPRAIACGSILKHTRSNLCQRGDRFFIQVIWL